MSATLKPTLPGDPAPAPARFYGKYRGIVQHNLDPLMLGRIIAQVSTVALTPSPWALPCTPYPAPGAQPLVVPPVGSTVWIEFEGGDLDFPIWSGCFWSEGQPPLLGLPASSSS